MLLRAQAWPALVLPAPRNEALEHVLVVRSGPHISPRFSLHYSKLFIAAQKTAGHPAGRSASAAPIPAWVRTHATWGRPASLCSSPLGTAPGQNFSLLGTPYFRPRHPPKLWGGPRWTLGCRETCLWTNKEWQHGRIFNLRNFDRYLLNECMTWRQPCWAEWWWGNVLE